MLSLIMYAQPVVNRDRNAKHLAEYRRLMAERRRSEHR
jgi:hypothetical protein